MKFEEGNAYYVRQGNQYTFVRKSSGVTVFADIEGKLTCRNDRGMYRWDDKQTDEDIVG